MDSVEVPVFQSDLDRSVNDLRGALTDLITGAGADPNLPQHLSRDFGLSKDLTWKIVRTISAIDSFSAVQHIPGATGMEIFISCFERAGVDKTRVEAARAAMREFDRVVDIHMGDRAALELVLDSMGGGEARQLELSRKLAYRGNSGIWGVQARVMATLNVVAPNRDDPSRLDGVLVGGFVGFRRLRPGASWPLFQVGNYRDDGTPMPTADHPEEVIEPNGLSTSGMRMIPEFCTGAVPEIEAVVNETSTSYSLGPGPVGKYGVFDCFFGQISRGHASRYRTENEEVCDFFAGVAAPVEIMLIDIVAHKELTFLHNPELAVYAIRSGRADIKADQKQNTRLPISESITRLGDQPPFFTTPLIPRYNELVQTVLKHADWDPRDFFGLRVAIKYPPMHSMVLLHSTLDEHP